MKMKNLLLGLLALIAVAPAWAQEAAPAAGVVIELNGPAKGISALLEGLEKDPVYQGAACSSGKKPGKTVKIKCAKADSALMDFLGRNTPATVRWSISYTAASDAISPLGCPAGCVLMNCPPPGGTYRCCNTSTYTPC